MSTRVERVPVVVIGAGPTGVAAAIQLGQRGVRCLVLDRWEDVYPQPRAVHLDDEVYRIVRRLGVGDQFAQVSRTAVGLRLVDQHLQVLGEFRREGLSPTTGLPRMNMFDQPELEVLLRARLRELGSVTFLGGQEVTAVEQVGPGRVRVHHCDVASGESRSVEAEVVLGCDGANSVARRSIGASLRDLGFEQRWLVIDVETEADLRQWDGVQQVCDATRAATFMRIGRHRYRWELRLQGHEDVADLATIELLHPLLRPWLGAVSVGELTLLRSTEYTFRAALANRWRSGRVFLLGDAAHLTPPFIGQGLGAGLRDADNLAWKVAGFLDGTLSADVLDSYEPERSAHARAMIGLARAMGTVMTRGGQVGGVLRRVVTPVLTRAPVVRHHVMDSTTPPLRPSALVAGSRRDRLSGRLCPDVTGGPRRFDEVVGPRWALVTSVALAPSDAAALDHHDVTVVDAAGHARLAAWLRDGRAAAALVRPDRTVLASGDDVAALVAAATGMVSPVGPVPGDSSRGARTASTVG